MRLPTYAFDKSSLWVNPERSVYVDTTDDPAPAAYAGPASPAAAAGGAASSADRKPPRALVRFGEEWSRQPAIKAYCLPFACGSSTVFAPWAGQADEAVEVIALELPGRGGRSEEKIPAEDAGDEALLEALCDMILADLGGAQYVLVGFSMGGGMCMELALRLAARKATMPLALYIAGRRPPALDPASIEDINMTNEELADYAFAPPEVARSAEFAEHVVPLLRADLGMDARTERRLSVANRAGRGLPAGVGLQVFCGVTDGIAPFTEAPGWQRFAKETVGMHYYPGGHEFMQEQRPALRTAWRGDAIGRLVQRRSMDIALLASQGYSAAPAPMLFAGVPSLTPAPVVEEKKALPLYSVQWVPVTVNGQNASRPSTFFVSLDGEVPVSTLDAAVTAMQGGATVVVACMPTGGVLSGQSLDVEVSQAWQFVRLVQHLLQAGVTGQLVLVCPAAGTGAMVAGASKAVAMEAGELKIKRLFVPPACLDFAQERASTFCAFVGRHPDEVDLWVQDKALQGFAYAPRLERMVEPSAKLLCVPRQRPDGSLATYVLTGATGGLGKSVVEWMVNDQGLHPEQLVLMRRAGAAALTGVLAKCRTVEMADPESADALIASPLRNIGGVSGILHLAGVLDDGIISSMTQERVQKVASPKCGLFLALLRAGAALGWPLRWACGFSSTSSLFGYAGQANYCAANAMLDQLATFGSAGVLPQGDQPPCRIMTINWGPWAEAGMAKVGTKAYEQAVKEGDTPLPTSSALACLAAALRVAEQAQPSAVQFCACDVEWEKSQWRELPILDLVFDRSKTEAPAPKVQEVKGKVSAESPKSIVEAFMLQHTKSGGSWKKIQGKSLHQLGLDSLETVQLRNLFNKKFSVNAPLGVFADVSLKLGELSESLSKYITTV
jgi:surfactin synthase thioesterase subunit/NAD(P)-dependent dehydrogenase (short-subunit alcohol dehydrogenase family)